MNSQPIGFMDSGVGGLTVVKAAIDKLPNEDVIYFGDEARLPYGEKSPQQIQTYAKEIAKFLLNKKIKVLVVACNTATSLALPILEKMLPIPVIGVIEPGSRLALENTRNYRVGVIATNGTVNSKAYDKTLKRLNHHVEVHSLGCPRFVPIVESGQYHSASVQREVDNDLASLKQSGIDTLVMGCTHYPLMQSLIQRAVGNQIHLVDPAEGVVEQLMVTLDQESLANRPHPVRYEFYTTGKQDSFTKIAEDWLKIPVHVQHVTLEELKNFE